MRDEYWVLWHKIKVWTISPFAKYNNSKLCVENSLKNIKLHRFLWIKINNKNNSRQSFLCTQKFLDFPKIFLISPKISSFPQKFLDFPKTNKARMQKFACISPTPKNSKKWNIRETSVPIVINPTDNSGRSENFRR